MKHAPSHRCRLLAPWWCAIALLAAPAAAHADAYRGEGNLWIRVAAFDLYDAPNLNYFNQGGQSLTIRLAEIKGLKMAEYPDLEKAEDALTKNDHKAALAAFQKVRRQAKQQWLQLWLDARLVPLLDKAGRGQEAAQAFITLLEAGAPQSFLTHPPIESVERMSKDAKKSVQAKFKELAGKVEKDSELWFNLNELVRASDPGAEPPPRTTDDGAAPGVVASVVPMPAFMLTGNVDPITRQLARGSYEAVIDRIRKTANDSLADRGSTSLRLYQLAVAQFYLSQQQGDSAEAKQNLMDAGLNFMRVSIYFPNSPYAGPALIEAAAVQIKLDRHDLAANLVERAEGLIDTDDKPMAERLEAVRGQVKG